MIKLAFLPPEIELIGIANKFVFKKKGIIKSFDLETEHGKYTLKIPKKLHENLNYALHPNLKVKVTLTSQICLKNGKIKLKIANISLISPISATVSSPQTATSPKKSKILICQKSTCWKRGGESIYHKIQEELQSRGLEDHVTVKKTGCMRHCKQAPNLVALPDKVRYHCFQEGEVSKLIDTHCDFSQP
jgi:(2Fe-2S) ferredoxin